MPRARGFTLLELLVAIAIFAVMAAMTYGGLIHVMGIQERLDAERNVQRAVIISLGRIEDDLAQARDRPIRDVDGSTVDAFIGRPPDTRALGLPFLELTRGGGAMITREDAPDARSPSDLQRIAYRLRDDGVLLRLSWPVLDRAPTTVPVEVPILDNIDAISLRFFDAGRWAETWPPLAAAPGGAAPPSMPAGVEITLTIRDIGEITRVLVVRG